MGRRIAAVAAVTVAISLGGAPGASAFTEVGSGCTGLIPFAVPNATWLQFEANKAHPLPFAVASSYTFACTAHVSGQMTIVVDHWPASPWARIRWRARELLTANT